MEKVARSKACTPGQVALAWVKAHSETPGMPQILPIPGTTREERLAENMKAANLDPAELNELNNIVKNAVVAGERYPEAYEKLCYA
jgi:pyridoxine 4-dehydrogenase